MPAATKVYRAANDVVYVELPTGAFLVVRPDGGTEERFTLPASAQPLVAVFADAESAA